MTRPQRWKEKDIEHGIMKVELASWKYFHDYVRQEMLEFSHYVWRGQHESKWPLESSLDRLLKTQPATDRAEIAKKHLERFKLAIRGRRGPHPSRIDEENEWWALGQHQGLATPLLDWTESPFVALYFAFEKAEKPSSGHRSVWALGTVKKKNKPIKEAHKGEGPAPTLDHIRPHQDENARLVSQAGLFTKAPLGETVDGWVRKHFKDDSQWAALIQLTVPDADREQCLRTLNKMNINHLTLFPDVFGASAHCNKTVEIAKY